MNLKTLKDLEPMEERFVFRNELKAEAIKHIKNICGDDNEGMVLKKYIMWANNVTEEDLKND